MITFGFMTSFSLSIQAMSLPVQDNEVDAKIMDNQLPLPRDGEFAILEQYEHAKKQNTRAAYELFIARNADHKLAQNAAKKIEDLD